MNFIQFLIFGIFATVTCVTGCAVYAVLQPEKGVRPSRCVWLGEVFLLGAIVVVGELLLLSLLHLYRPPVMWAVVTSNLAVLAAPCVRKELVRLWGRPWPVTLPGSVMLGLVLFFVFRNCFFLMDVDSHSTYLYTQKLWLEYGTSLVGGPATDIRVFSPQFDAVPYGLGLGLFPGETFFPQLINLFWRLIVLLLVFGYAAARFRPVYGLAAALLVMLNDHFYMSGANAFVVINGAVMAFLFAAAYNFWEARVRGDAFRIVLALIFVCQTMSNKYQIALVAIFVVLAGCWVQPDGWRKLKAILASRRWVIAITASVLVMSLHYVKNFLVTGLAVFPVFAGRFGVLNWTPEMGDVFMKIQGGVGPGTFLKYMSYLFIWPGMTAAKIVILISMLFPLILLAGHRRHPVKSYAFDEWAYWGGLSILAVAGTCLACHQDPRYYRYPLAILAFAAVVGVDIVFKQCWGWRRQWVVSGLLVVLALSGWRIMLATANGRPTVQENLAVLTNRLHTADVLERYFPESVRALAALKDHPDKLAHAAWDTGIAGFRKLSPWLLPLRPQLGLWHTTVVNWESYTRAEDVAADVRTAGIDWVMQAGAEEFRMITPEAYAAEAVAYQRFPRQTLYNYSFPPELYTVRY